MPTYIILSNLSEQGLQTLRANPDRMREVNRDVEELGARVLHQWFILGPYDFVNIVEAPDAKTIARIAVAIGARGSTNMQSYEAIEAKEFLDLVGG
ncbi:MAG: GYD domain-containing protein [Actinomycetota bacterium]|nr:GYD domain-containing protein [Actinomycetota bacterium]